MEWLGNIYGDVKKAAERIAPNSYIADDLAQEMILILAEKKELVIALQKKKQLNFYIYSLASRLCKQQNNSFYRKFIKDSPDIPTGYQGESTEDVLYAEKINALPHFDKLVLKLYHHCGNALAVAQLTKVKTWRIRKQIHDIKIKLSA